MNIQMYLNGLKNDTQTNSKKQVSFLKCIIKWFKCSCVILVRLNIQRTILLTWYYTVPKFTIILVMFFLMFSYCRNNFHTVLKFGNIQLLNFTKLLM